MKQPFDGLFGFLTPEWREIQRTKADVASLQSSALESADTAGRVNMLAMKIEHMEKNLLALGLYSRTILQMLVEADVVTIEAFHEKLQEIDLLDGVLDGK